MTVIKDAVASTLAEMGPGGAASDCDEVIAIILGTGTDGAPGTPRKRSRCSCGTSSLPTPCVERFVESRVRLGVIPPDQTNLVGSRLYLLQQERRVG